MCTYVLRIDEDKYILYIIVHMFIYMRIVVGGVVRVVVAVKYLDHTWTILSKLKGLSLFQKVV